MTKQASYHFIGIGGIGMSGLAKILISKNISISGSDITTNYLTEDLKEKGASIAIGHSASNIPQGATVVYSSDIKKTNPEFMAAQENNHSLLHRSDLLLELMQNSKTLAVTGTHGKTTTSSLLTWVLHNANKAPSFAIGGVIPQLNSNAGYGAGEFFVAEADESDGTFLKYNSYGAIVTNIDADHMDYYKTMEHLIDSFKQFLDKVSSNHLFWCGDNPLLLKLKPKGFSYGYNNACDLHITEAKQKNWSNIFSFRFLEKDYKDVEVSLVGKHNILNAAAVFGLALSLGLDEQSIREGLKTFAGVKRRAEKKAEIQNILFLDDYAHHPVEIKTTLEGIRKAVGNRRIIAVFQPHRYSRTKDVLGSYKHIFKDADEIFVTEIYSAGETPIPGVNKEAIIKELESDGITHCHNTTRKEVAKEIANFAKTHDVIVSLGAGDITKLASEVLEEYKQNSPCKLKVGILFGGRSTEHEITLLSATHIKNCVSEKIYDVELFGITKEGVWINNKDSLKTLKEFHKNKTQLNASLLDDNILQKLLTCDLVIPVFHGPLGEDGTVQGFLEVLGKAYAGPDHMSAAIAMDKAITKHLMRAHQIPTLNFVEISKKEWAHSQEEFLQKIQTTLQFPLFIKPVHLGSTVGIRRVDSLENLIASIEESFLYDYKIIIEQGLTSLREIEFAVLGNEEALTFAPGEILAKGDVYDFDAKYGPQGMQANPKANLPKELIEEGKKLALKAYKAIDGSGMARVDFFLDSNNQFWLNEINPIPGFTPISLYPKICEVNGIAGQELLDRLILLGLERKRRNAVLCRNR